ncbi:MAG: hypothetical protein LW636_04180 [Planctomycetaceae bacterium]|nr:hypothetical protein [Planctomycetaceae bacterium]
MKLQLRIVGLPLLMIRMPPPRSRLLVLAPFALPARTVKPSRTAVDAAPEPMTTWYELSVRFSVPESLPSRSPVSVHRFAAGSRCASDFSPPAKPP